MARQPKRYDLNAVDDIASSLRHLPPAEPGMITRREAVERLKPVIQEMRKKGYSIEQITHQLKERGIVTTPSTLKADLRTPRRRKALARTSESG